MSAASPYRFAIVHPRIARIDSTGIKGWRPRQTDTLIVPFSAASKEVGVETFIARSIASSLQRPKEVALR
jgi:hypothetical protein